MIASTHFPLLCLPIPALPNPKIIALSSYRLHFILKITNFELYKIFLQFYIVVVLWQSLLELYGCCFYV